MLFYYAFSRPTGTVKYTVFNMERAGLVTTEYDWLSCPFLSVFFPRSNTQREFNSKICDSSIYQSQHFQITIEYEMDTLYWCKILKAPVLQDKHHIIGYEALLTKERYAFNKF